MKSIASDFYQINFSENDEKKSPFECKSYENIHPNDVVGWYEKIYRGFDHFQSEMYAIDSRDGYQENLKGVHLSNTQNVSDSNCYTSKQDAIEINLQVPLRYDNTVMNSESKIENIIEHNNYKDGNSSLCNLDFESILKMDKSKRISNEEIKNQLSIISSYEDKPSESHISKISKTSEDLNVCMNQNKCKNIIRRWSRELDCKAFEYLNNELSKINMSIDQFLFDEDANIVDDIKQRIICNFRLTLIKQIIRRFKWHKTTYLLFKRLRRLTENQEFSFRDLKLLKRVAKQQRKDGKYDIKALSSLLPGKFHSTIRNVCKDLLKLDACPF